jgi:hypothetical protein
MKILSSFLFIFWFGVTTGTCVDLGYYTMLGKKEDQEKWGKLVNELNKADITTSITIEGKYRIGVGRKNAEGVFVEVTFVIEELEHFFEKQRHKDLIVIRIEKRPKPFDRKDTQNVADFFIRRGYSRVIVCVELSNGLQVIWDGKN